MTSQSSSEHLPDEVMPTYWQFLQGTVTAFREFGLDWQKYPVNYSLIYSQLTSITVFDSSVILGIALTFTLARYVLTAAVYDPLGRWLKLRRQDMIKFAESCWKLMLYVSLWSFSCYVIIISGRHDYFVNPCRIWKNIFVENTPIPSDVQAMYLFQTAFYIHSIYATFRMDAWRKDSLMMLFHHGLTILLLYISYCMGYHKMGSLVLFLHDLSDVFLEFTKINVYLKTRGGRIHIFNDFLSTIGFLLFALSWAWCRLYWFPLKVIHSTNWGVYLYHINKDPRMYLVLNIMLFALQLLHIYWFYFIILFIYKIATGQVESVEDTREYDSDSEPSEKASESSEKVSESKFHDDDVANGDAYLRHRNGIR